MPDMLVAGPDEPDLITEDALRRGEPLDGCMAHRLAIAQLEGGIRDLARKWLDRAAELHGSPALLDQAEAGVIEGHVLELQCLLRKTREGLHG